MINHIGTVGRWKNHKGEELVLKVLGNIEIFGRRPIGEFVFVQLLTAQGSNGIFSVKQSELYS